MWCQASAAAGSKPAQRAISAAHTGSCRDVSPSSRPATASASARTSAASAPGSTRATIRCISNPRDRRNASMEKSAACSPTALPFSEPDRPANHVTEAPDFPVPHPATATPAHPGSCSGKDSACEGHHQPPLQAGLKNLAKHGGKQPLDIFQESPGGSHWSRIALPIQARFREGRHFSSLLPHPKTAGRFFHNRKGRSSPDSQATRLERPPSALRESPRSRLTPAGPGRAFGGSK